VTCKERDQTGPKEDPECPVMSWNSGAMPAQLRTWPKAMSHFTVPAWPGNCIRKQFAMNELKVAVALTLFRFELLPDPTKIPDPMARVTLKSKNGIYLHIRKLQ
jgi:hypothetical protein